MALQYGILDTVDDVIDLFVMWLNSARKRRQTLEFFGLDPEDESNQKRIRGLENGQCMMQDLYGHVGVVQFHPVFADFLHGFDTKPPMKAGVAV